MMPVQPLIIRRPDDWHVHLRDDQMLAAVLPATAEIFARAIVMPNLKPPITTAKAAAAYRARILAALPAGQRFTPLMTCYLTDTIDTDDLTAGFRDGIWIAAKLYPAGATTNADAGVTALTRIHRTLEVLQDLGMPLLVHGEVVASDVDVFDREAVFIERELTPLRRDFPALKLVFEHLTTQEGVDFVREAAGPTAATVTPHHLLINRNAMFERGIRPHAYCLPVAKREHHRLALRAAVISGNPRFFLGTDSAPHPRHLKEHACGCAGVYNAPTAMACYAQVFAEEHALAKLEGFASRFGPQFYGLPENCDFLELSAGPAAEDAADLQTAEGAVSIFTAPGVTSWRTRLLA
jgi:dihydroorotase